MEQLAIPDQLKSADFWLAEIDVPNNAQVTKFYPIGHDGDGFTVVFTHHPNATDARADGDPMKIKIANERGGGDSWSADISRASFGVCLSPWQITQEQLAGTLAFCFGLHGEWWAG